jgi:hypothetical protein
VGLCGQAPAGFQLIDSKAVPYQSIFKDVASTAALQQDVTSFVSTLFYYGSILGARLKSPAVYQSVGYFPVKGLTADDFLASAALLGARMSTREKLQVPPRRAAAHWLQMPAPLCLGRLEK